MKRAKWDNQIEKPTQTSLAQGKHKLARHDQVLQGKNGKEREREKKKRVNECVEVYASASI
jgi:hypothetical protein